MGRKRKRRRRRRRRRRRAFPFTVAGLFVDDDRVLEKINLLVFSYNNSF